MFNSRGNIFSALPPVTKNLVIINALVWFAAFLFHNVSEFVVRYCALHYIEASDFNAVQLVTYMFLQLNFTHLFFNMFSLFIFGQVLERVWGSKRFLFYYISTGIGAAIVQEVVWAFTITDGLSLIDQVTQQVSLTGAEALQYAQAHGMDLSRFYNSNVTLGASGAVFGVLLAFGMMFPNVPMYIMFIPVPIKAKYMVIGYGVIELFLGVGGLQQGVAHFAHLGGMLFGIIILLVWKKKGILGGGGYY